MYQNSGTGIDSFWRLKLACLMDLVEEKSNGLCLSLSALPLSLSTWFVNEHLWLCVFQSLMVSLLPCWVCEALFVPSVEFYDHHIFLEVIYVLLLLLQCSHLCLGSWFDE